MNSDSSHKLSLRHHLLKTLEAQLTEQRAEFVKYLAGWFLDTSTDEDGRDLAQLLLDGIVNKILVVGGHSILQQRIPVKAWPSICLATWEMWKNHPGNFELEYQRIAAIQFANAQASMRQFLRKRGPR